MQLPPVKLQQVFTSLDSLFGAMCNLWLNFSIYELSEVMRQLEDTEFIALLNSVCIGNISDAHVKFIQSREVSIQNLGNNVNLLFAKYGKLYYPKDEYNCMKLKCNC